MVARWTWQPGGSPAKAKPPGKLDRHFAVIKALRYSPLTSNERHLVRAIEDFADNETGEAYPSIRALVEVTRMGRSTLLKAIAGAVGKGWLAADKRASKLGTTVYRVTPPPPIEPSPESGQRSRG